MREAVKLNLKELFFIFGAFVLVIGNSGVWFMPNLNLQFMVSQNLLKISFDDPNAHYIFFNYFEPLLYALMGGKSLTGYVVYTLLITALFLLIFIFWFVSYHGKNISLDQNKLFVAITFPVFMIPFYWIGMDGMTLLLILLVLININRVKIALLFSFMLGLQHFEQAFIGFAVLLGTLLTHYAVSRHKSSLDILKTVTFILLSIVSAKLMLMLFFHYMDVGLSGDRNSYLKNNIYLYFRMWKNSWPIILWTLFATGWLFVVLNLKKLWPLLVAVLITFLLTAIVGDQTRVGIIVLFPSLFYWVFMNKEIWSSLSQKAVVIIICSYLFMPIIVVWGEAHIGNLWKYDRTITQQVYNSGFQLEKLDLLMPFRGMNTSGNLAQPLTEFRAKISADNVKVICQKEKECLINLDVTNISNATWYSKGQYIVNLGYHITSEDGQPILFDGVRTSLPHEISSGVTLPLQLTIKPNLQAGSYIVEADMVQEGVSWFGKKDKTNIFSIFLDIK